MKRIYFGVIVLILLLVLWINGPDRKYAFDYPIPTEIHYHAGFLVVKDGEIQDYSSTEFMKVEPCLIHEDEELSDEQEQLEKAHLHDNVGDVVHVHRKNATWKDLFVNAGIEVPEDAYAYQRGAKVENISERVIEEDESIIVIVGDEPIDIGPILTQEVSRDHIAEIGNSSENCGS